MEEETDKEETKRINVKRKTDQTNPSAVDKIKIYDFFSSRQHYRKWGHTHNEKSMGIKYIVLFAFL